MGRRLAPCCAAASVLLCAAGFSEAAADQFSYNCTHSGVWERFTFDDATKRVIGFGPWNQQVVFTGTITAITPDEIRFDLVLPFDKIRIGSFALNRKENWMTSLGFPGRADLKDPCDLGPPAPVLDLWRALSVQNP
jgi:hypothetical protein